MTITIPLRLPDTAIADADKVIEARLGATSRNAVLREAALIGLRVLLSEDKK